MRTFSYILTTLVTIFVLNVALSFSLPAYRNALVNVRNGIFPDSTKVVPNQESYKEPENNRLIESLDRIDKHIETLAEIQKTDIPRTVASSGNIASTGSGNTLSGVTTPVVETIIIPPVEPEIPLSWLFLAKVMPEVTMKKIDNSGFFGIQVMEKILYSTYMDEKKKIKVYAFRDTYDTILLNMKLAGSVYKLNETDQFFGYTFFLNLTKKDSKDTTIRFITALEGRAIGVEVPKDYYPILKKMLLKK